MGITTGPPRSVAVTAPGRCLVGARQPAARWPRAANARGRPVSWRMPRSRDESRHDMPDATAVGAHPTTDRGRADLERPRRMWSRHTGRQHRTPSVTRGARHRCRDQASGGVASAGAHAPELVTSWCSISQSGGAGRPQWSAIHVTDVTRPPWQVTDKACRSPTGLGLGGGEVSLKNDPAWIWQVLRGPRDRRRSRLLPKGRIWSGRRLHYPTLLATRWYPLHTAQPPDPACVWLHTVWGLARVRRADVELQGSAFPNG
jgi:hypothetical protein